MRGRPLHGCQHVGTVSYGVLRAECSRCGAVWERSSDGPWRVVFAGAEPDEPNAFACEGCGARYREQPRTCFVCGRPHGGPAGPVRRGAPFVPTTAATIPLDDDEAGMRAD